MTQAQQIEQLKAQLASTAPVFTEKKSLGPFALIGKVFNTIGTAVDAVDKLVVNTDKQLDKGYEAINIVSTGMVTDLATDEIVNSAHRDVRTAQATAQAKSIMDSLSI